LTSSLRKIIENGYTPQPAAVVDRMLYDTHQLDTPQAVTPGGSLELRHGAVVVENPLDGGTERYVAVQLDTPQSAEFERPQVDLAVVLDVSDSMGGPVDGYYYGGESGGTTKLEVATRGLCALTRQLCENDRLAVVLCNQQAVVAKPLDEIASTDTVAIRRHIHEIACGGDTNLADGVETAIDVLESGTTPRSEQRVLLVTDTMPNTGSTGRDGLARVFADAATDGVHTTLVGVGLDANDAVGCLWREPVLC
jgi:Ca-activated chloride channel family protein